jgi:V8-like Glu-specific endopeptidase
VTSDDLGSFIVGGEIASIRPAGAAGGFGTTSALIGVGDSLTRGFNASDQATTAWAPLTAAAFDASFTNHAEASATMLGTPDVPLVTPILTQMLSITPPGPETAVVGIVGTNELYYHGLDPAAMASFAAGFRRGLLWVTSNGCSVWIGTTTRQSVYSGAGSEAARIAYVSLIVSIIDTVASQGRQVYAVDLDGVYDPKTMGSDPPQNVHPGDRGHAAIAVPMIRAIGGRPRQLSVVKTRVGVGVMDVSMATQYPSSAITDIQFRAARGVGSITDVVVSGSTASFTLTRAAPNVAVMQALTVFDTFGSWLTFVGGDPGSF